LEVVLAAGVLVPEVHVHVGARGEDAGGEGLFGGGADLTGEEDPDLVGPADPDVVGHERFEEPSGSAGVVEDQGAGHLDLAHGKFAERPPLIEGTCSPRPAPGVLDPVLRPCLSSASLRESRGGWATTSTGGGEVRARSSGR